jgi:exoribonuclease R
MSKDPVWKFWDKESMVFSIDTKGARALDDCLSIDELLDDKGHTVFKVSVHISFVDFWVKEDSAVDKDAK